MIEYTCDFYYYSSYDNTGPTFRGCYWHVLFQCNICILYDDFHLGNGTNGILIRPDEYKDSLLDESDGLSNSKTVTVNLIWTPTDEIFLDMDYIIDEAYKLCVQFQYIFDMAAFQPHELTWFGELTFGSYTFCMAVYTAYAFFAGYAYIHLLSAVVHLSSMFLQLIPTFHFFFCSWYLCLLFSAVDTSAQWLWWEHGERDEPREDRTV